VYIMKSVTITCDVVAGFRQFESGIPFVIFYWQNRRLYLNGLVVSHRSAQTVFYWKVVITGSI